jgi:hypothetical protein
MNSSIYILSDCKAAIKALSKHQIISKLVWDCHQSLMQLAMRVLMAMKWQISWPNWNLNDRS